MSPMGLEERARRADEEAPKEAVLRRIRLEKERRARVRQAHEYAKAQTFIAFQEHIERWAKQLEVPTPNWEEAGYNRDSQEPVHRARAKFAVDGIEFDALFTMREKPDPPLSQPFRPGTPTNVLTVYLLKDSSRRYPIDTLEALGKALKKTDKV